MSNPAPPQNTPQNTPQPAPPQTNLIPNPLQSAVRLWKTETIPESSPFTAWLFVPTKDAAAEAKKLMKTPFLADRITTPRAFAELLVRIRCPNLTFITSEEQIIILEKLMKKTGFMQKLRKECGAAEQVKEAGKETGKDAAKGTVKDNIPLTFVNQIVGQYYFIRLNKIEVGRKTAKHAAVSDLFDAYETYCREHALADNIIILKTAAELLRQEEAEAKGEGSIPVIEKSVIFGIRHPEKLLEELLTEIRKRDHIEMADEPQEVFSSAAEETVSFVCKSRESEAEQILERAAELIETGVSPSEILIITPSGAETARLVAERAADFYAVLPASGDLEGEDSEGEDFEGEDFEGKDSERKDSDAEASGMAVRPLQITGVAAGGAIAAHPVIQCVLSALHAVSAEYEIDDLESVIASPYLKAPASYGMEGKLTPGILEQMSAAFGTEKGEKEWLRIAELVAEKCRETEEDGHRNDYRRFEAAAAEIPLLLSWIQGVFSAASDAASKTFRGRAEALLQWLEVAGWTAPQTDAAAASAQKVFQEYLTSVSGTVTGDYRCSAQEFYSHIFRYALSRREEPRRSLGDCIRMTTLRKAAGLRAEYVFLAGLEAEHLPAADTVLSPFTAAETAELLAPLGKDIFREEEERFSSALQTARKKLYLSYAESDGKKQLVRSVFLNGFSGFTDQDAAGSLKKEKEIRHSVKKNRIRAGRALRSPEKYSASLSGAAGLTDPESVIRRIRAAGAGPGVFEGDAKKLFAKRGSGASALSPTSIETYLGCPYKWYLEKHLRLFTPSEIDKVSSRKGTVVHAVLEEFVKTFGEPVTDENIKEAYEFIRKIAREKFDAEKLETPEWKATAAWYCDDGDDERWHFRPFYAFLENEAELAKERWETTSSRTEYKLKETIEYDGFSFQCNATIDRVIERDAKESDAEKSDGEKSSGEKPREFCIIDYKSGKDLPDEKRAVQLPLYAAAYQKKSGLTPAAGTYFHINEKKTEVKPAGAKKEEFSTVVECGLENAASAAAGIRGAQLRPMPAEGACEYCPYKRFCKSAVKSSCGGA